jgi:hypothetical protein
MQICKFLIYVLVIFVPVLFVHRLYIFGYVVFLLIAIIDLFLILPWKSKLNEFSVSVLFLFIFSFLSRCYSAKMYVNFIIQTTYM